MLHPLNLPVKSHPDCFASLSVDASCVLPRVSRTQVDWAETCHCLCFWLRSDYHLTNERSMQFGSLSVAFATTFTTLRSMTNSYLGTLSMIMIFLTHTTTGF